MQMPRQLYDCNVFVDGRSTMGENKSVTLPKIAEKLEVWRGSGMIAEIDLAVGIEKLVLGHKYGGDIPAIERTFADPRLDAAQIRFAGAYKNGAGYDDVQVTVRGKTHSIDRGDQATGEKTEVSYETTCVYYKQERNGVVEFEIDKLNGVLIVHGVDRLAEVRAIIGR